MTDDITGLPFWEVEFDAEGDPDPGRRATLAEVRRIGDVVLLRYALSSRFRAE